VTSDPGFVDVNCGLGPRTGATDLRDLQRTAGIGLGLARHLPNGAGDGLLPVAAGAEPNAVAVWVEVRDATARAEADRRALQTAARAGMPLLVPLGAWGDATAIAEMTAGLGVSVVLTGAHYTHFADDVAAAERYEHVLLETSAMAHFGAIEMAVSRLGAERLLLGTGLPRRCARSSVNAVLSSRIGDDSKRKILGDNARRVFALPPHQVQLPDPVSAVDAVDVHCHFEVSGFPTEPVSDDHLATELGRFGVRTVIASSLVAIASDLEAGNEAMAAACSAPDQLGYVVADPNDLEATRFALRRHSGQDVVGVKVHCQYSGQPTASRAIWDLFELLAQDGRPVKIHNDGPGWDKALLEVARARARLPIIVAHGGLGAPSLEAARLVAMTDNVHLELSSSFAERAIVSELVRVAGTERLMFGSDAPLLNPAFVIGTYLEAGIPENRWDAVWRDNARSLFGLS
jgi:predicted TIM-barrel fold metal-dependent hydrolase